MKKKFLIFTILILTGFMFACKTSENTTKPDDTKIDSEKTDENTDESSKKESVYSPSNLKIVTIKGPTGMSLAPMAPKLGTNLSIENNIEAVLAKFKKDEGDIFFIPSNLYAKLKNSGSDIKVLNSNVGTALSFLTLDDELKDFSDINGRTIAMTGRGAVPEIILNKLLDVYQVDVASLNINWVSEPSEIAGILKQDPKTLLLLPEPLASTMTTKNPELKTPFSLKDIWSDKELPQIITSVIVTTNKVYEEKKNDIIKFLNNYVSLIDIANSKKDDFAKAISQISITSEEIARKSIDSIEFVHFTGKALYDRLDDFFNMILETQPDLIGGKLPDYAS